ncbi:MAG: VWA domain-containing protein [Gammaproteobacteria bacterium]|nr:VWA domain-containing protein [Gammaproteobacteria bacterium]
MRRRRKTEGFNLAFLDVMSCGLGAVILIFLIVKHNVDKGSVEADIVLAELETLERQERQLQEQVREIGERGAGERELGAELKEKLRGIEQTIAALGEQMAAQKRKNAELRSAMEKDAVRKAADVVPDESVGEERYLTGLEVEGRRVAILVDYSASMTDEKLVDIVVRKTGSDANKKNGPKWRRTKKAVRWLLNRLPEKSEVAVIVFNGAARTLGAAAWNNSQDRAALGALFGEIEKLVPSGATNLQAGLNELRKLRPRATNIYLITDGLPTKGVTRPSFLSSCRSIFGKSSNISGECRAKLFRAALQSSPPTGGEKVNVILFPLEGDPAAAPNFWNWAAVTGGLMLTPAAGWP